MLAYYRAISAAVGIARRRERKVWNQRRKPFSPCNLLILHKTAKEIFGKAWRFQAENLEKLDKKLGESLEICVIVL